MNKGPAFIEIQDLTGNWVRVASVLNQDQTIKNAVDSAMRQAKKTARAVDSSGNIIQLKPR